MKAKGSQPVFILQTYEERLKNNKNSELSQKLAERLSDLQLQHGGATDGIKRLTLNKTHSENSMPPPPPLPPQLNGTMAGSSTSSSTPSSPTPSTRSNTLKKPKAPPVPVKYSVLSYKASTNNILPNSSPVKNNRFNQPPPCPTPDYDTLSLASSYSSGLAPKQLLKQTKNDDSAEMQSIDSFKINNSTSNIQPKPPSTYFQKRPITTSLSNQSTASKTSTIRKSRPISVTIGEYPSMRRLPGRLDFLQNGNDVADGKNKESNIGNSLTSELTQTLNRSNLKKRTESMANPHKG